MSSSLSKRTEFVPEEVLEKRRPPTVPVASELPKPIEQVLLKRIPVEFHGVKPDNFNDETIWMPIYRFPYVNGLRRLIRFKVYLTTFSMITVAERVYTMLSDGSTNVITTAALSTISLTGLIIVGDLFRKLVCQIYTSPDAGYIRLCRFSFFGRRIDMVLPRDLVLPLTETNTSGYKNIFTIIRPVQPQKIDLSYDMIEFYDEKFYLPLRYGKILDKERFAHAMGQTILERKVVGG